MFLVTGATGNVGRHVVAELLARGAQVRAMTRNPDGAALPAGADVVDGDLDEPSGWAAALRDVEAVYLFPRGDTEAFLAEAKRAGVRRVVTLSSISVSTIDTRPNGIAAMHGVVERAVEVSGLEWTHLRPDTFAANTLSWAPGVRELRAVRIAYPEAKFPAVHEADIAAVAVRALCDATHAGVVYELTGPEWISQRDQVLAIGAAIGEPVELMEIAPETAIAELLAKGVPEPVVHAMMGHMAESVTSPSPVRKDVATVTGTAPLDYARWAADHAADFR